MNVQNGNDLIRKILSRKISAINCSKSGKSLLEVRTEVRTLTFSSHSNQRQNAETLRALGKSANRRSSKETELRRDNGPRQTKHKIISSSSTFQFGEAAFEAEKEGQQGRVSGYSVNPSERKKIEDDHGVEFVSFFDLVDARIMAGRHNRNRMSTDIKKVDTSESSSLASFFESLKDPQSVSKSKEDRVSGENQRRPPQFTSAYLSSLENNSRDKTKSIFDAFPTPTPPKPRSPNAYDEDIFNEYKEMVEGITKHPRFLKDHTNKPIAQEIMQPVTEWLLKDEPVMSYNFHTLTNAIEYGISVSSGGHNDSNKNQKNNNGNIHNVIMDVQDSQTKQFRLELDDQRNDFLRIMDFTSQQYDLALRVMKKIADMCAKRARGSPIDIAWEKIKEAGMIPNENIMNTCLYVVSTASGSSLTMSSFLHQKRKKGTSLFSVGEKKKEDNNSIFDILSNDLEVEEKDRGELVDKNTKKQNKFVDVPQEIALFHDLLYHPTEKSISIRVKGLVVKGEAKSAQELLDAYPTRDDIRLRTYLPVMRLYCEQGDVSSALKLFKRMRNTPTVLLEPENYVLLIATVAENGYFRHDSKEIDGATEIGYSVGFGPGLLDLLVAEMEEDVLEISSASARRLYNAFAKGFEGQKMAKNLKELHSLAGIMPDNKPAEDGLLVANRVTIDEQTGVCPVTRASLRLIVLEKEQRKQLHDSLLKLSETQFAKFGGNKSNLRFASRELNRFARMLNNRKGKPFTAIIDGANVAYYMQNFDQGKFNLFQIQFMVDALIQKNENPLVILPSKYFSETFYTSTGGSYDKQVLCRRELDIIKSLKRSGRVFKVPSGCLDDYYWMLASVSPQAMSRDGSDIYVATNNSEGRWPGTRPMLITNDQMRDHKLELMEPRLFRRWYSCHIVNYNFTAFVDDECIDREIGFSTADFFSREIQGNNTSSGSESDDGVGTAWHFPVKDWDLNERFCIRVPRRDEK